MDYCRGLMLPIKRMSAEPLAAHVDPLHVQAKHQSLHHFVAKSPDGARHLDNFVESFSPAAARMIGVLQMLTTSLQTGYGRLTRAA
jgi:SRSO17 transposase